MAEMTDSQRRWFAGVFEAVGSITIVDGVGPRTKYKAMQIDIGPVRGTVADRLVDYLGNGWVQEGDHFQLRGHAACRGLFEEIWKIVTPDTRTLINEKLRAWKKANS